MNDDELDIDGVMAADRRDNRRSTLVVTIGVLIVVAASATLMAGAHRSPELAAPVPEPSSSGVVVHGQLPTAPFTEEN